MEKKLRLGELLLNGGVISQAQLDEALAIQQKTQNRLGAVLVESGILSEELLLDFLSKQLVIPVIDLRHYDFDESLTSYLPENYARRFRAILLKKTSAGFLTGMVDPFDLSGQDELRRILKMPIELALVKKKDLLVSLDLIYRRTAEIKSFAGELHQQLSDHALDDINLSALVDSEKDSPVAKLLRSIFEDAVQVNASDIHIEPEEGKLRIRQRVDGVLQEQIVSENRIADALTLKLKLLANLNISEKRMPQDGRFSLKVRHKTIDVRLSTLPVKLGESVVMRIHDSQRRFDSLENLGMPATLSTQLRHLVKTPNGIILVTGPTGSGKTATLYSLLEELNEPGVKIITAEDPVEYRIPGLNQVQIDPNVGLTFPNVLRAMLRQDPDVLLVGEIRDEETAELALRAALTGHLVLATLHTKDASGAIVRLLDLGVPKFILSASLRGVLAQRLVRCICDNCVASYTCNQEEHTWIETMAPVLDLSALKKGQGCKYCHHSGYLGRIGLFELLSLNKEIVTLLRDQDLKNFVEITQSQDHTLLQHAIQLIASGKTTVSEVIRVIGYGGDEV